jgi:hypothetical protein
MGTDDNVLDINIDDILSESIIQEVVSGISDGGLIKEEEPNKINISEEYREAVSLPAPNRYESAINVPTDMTKIITNINQNPSQVLQLNLTAQTAVQKTIEDPTESDPLYNAIKSDDPTVSVLREASLQLVEEVSWMRAWRKENFAIDDDKTSEISDKIMKAMNKLIELIMKKEAIVNTKGKDKIDFHGENFTKIFEHFVKIVQKTMEKVNTPKEYVDVFFSELAKNMDGFEKTAEKIYYGKKVTT